MPSLRRFSPMGFRRVAWWALAAQIGIVITGASVRLTGSGLGCTDWPGCSEDRLVPEWGFHHWVEFGNRLLTFVVTATALAAVVAARRRRPYRRELWWLAWVLVAGVAAQALIGGVLVLLELDPRLNVLHFVTSMVLIGAAVTLVHRSARDGGLSGPSLIGRAPGDRLPGRDGMRLRRAALALSLAITIVVGTGTVVTGTGPHGGDERADRFSFALTTVTRVHATAMWVFVGLLAVTTVLALRAGRPAEWLRSNLSALWALTAGQAVLGYLQYSLGVPAGLVALHVAGSALVWTTSVALLLKISPPGPAAAAPQPRSAPIQRADSAAGPVLSDR